MLMADFEDEQEGITVPYPPLFDGIRRNHGFVDLRGRAHLVAKIPETAQSEALKRLLTKLAEPGSPLLTLGCDLGTHEEQLKEGETASPIAGGYIQFMDTCYADRSSDDYVRFARYIAEALESEAEGHNWIVRFTPTFVMFNLDNYSNLTPSLWVWFYAAGHSPEDALASREALIDSLGQKALSIVREEASDSENCERQQ
jgi:hypothetical protein